MKYLTKNDAEPPRLGNAPPGLLRRCYALSGTAIASHIVLRRISCYALSGTDAEHGAICLWTCYAMSGTDMAVAAVRY